MHKLEEVKAKRQTIGAIKCIWTTKRSTLLSFLFGGKISFIEILARTNHFLKNRTKLFYCLCTNFTKSSHRDLKRVNPSLVLTCARLHFQYGAGNCKKVYWYRSNTLPSIAHPSKWWGCQSFLSLLKPIFAFSLKSSWDLVGHSLIFANTNIVINAL